MFKEIMPSNFEKMDRLVFEKYLPKLEKLFADPADCSELDQESAYLMREILSVKIILDYFIEYYEVIAPTA